MHFTLESRTHKKLRVEVTGHVAADGIAPYRFDKTHYGEWYSKTWTHAETGVTYTNVEYKMSMLEEAVLGYLKERMVDRQTSDITDAYFHVAKTPFADRFIECIKNEFSSIQNGNDTGIRTSQENELIQRHMTRSTYWPSRWHNPNFMRTGEYIRTRLLNGNTDPYAAVELNEFNITVKIPGNGLHDDGCLIQ